MAVSIWILREHESLFVLDTIYDRSVDHGEIYCSPSRSFELKSCVSWPKT